VSEFLFDQNNVFFETQELFDLWERMLDWTADEEARARNLLAANAEVMSKLEALLPQPRASIRSLYALTGFDRTPDWRAYNGRRWVPAFCLTEFEARLAYQEGRFDNALDAYALMLQLDRHLRGFPLHGNLLLFYWDMNPRLLARILLYGQFSESAVRSFEGVLEKSGGREDLVRGTQEEAFLLCKHFEDPKLIMKEVQQSGNVGIFMQLLGVAYASPLCDFKRQMDETLLLKMHSIELKLLRAPYFQARELGKEYQDQYSHLSIEKPPILRRRPMDTMEIMLGQALLAEARIAMALNRYHEKTGAYPDELQALVPEHLSEIPTDPFSGEPMHYLPAGKDYVLFSAGENGTYELKTEGKERTKELTAGGTPVWPGDDDVWGLRARW
jgi:hypothetical protein